MKLAFALQVLYQGVYNPYCKKYYFYMRVKLGFCQKYIERTKIIKGSLQFSNLRYYENISLTEMQLCAVKCNTVNMKKQTNKKQLMFAN